MQREVAVHVVVATHISLSGPTGAAAVVADGNRVIFIDGNFDSVAWSGITALL